MKVLNVEDSIRLKYNYAAKEKEVAGGQGAQEA
jgi:hypothetical protein